MAVMTDSLKSVGHALLALCHLKWFGQDPKYHQSHLQLERYLVSFQVLQSYTAYQYRYHGVNRRLCKLFYVLPGRIEFIDDCLLQNSTGRE